MLLLPAMCGPISAQMFPIGKSSDWIDREFWILIRLIARWSRAARRSFSRMDGPGVGKCFCGLELALWSESYGSALAVMIRW